MDSQCTMWCIIDSVDKTQSDCGADESDTIPGLTTDAEPTTLQHELQLSLKDYIIGYPTQTGNNIAWKNSYFSISRNVFAFNDSADCRNMQPKFMSLSSFLTTISFSGVVFIVHQHTAADAGY